MAESSRCGIFKNPLACRHVVEKVWFWQQFCHLIISGILKDCLCVRPHVTFTKCDFYKLSMRQLGPKSFLYCMFVCFIQQHRKTVVVTQYAMTFINDLTGITEKCDDHKAIWNGFEAPNVFNFNPLPMQKITLDANTIRLN